MKIAFVLDRSSCSPPICEGANTQGRRAEQSPRQTFKLANGIMKVDKQRENVTEKHHVPDNDGKGYKYNGGGSVLSSRKDVHNAQGEDREAPSRKKAGDGD